MWTTIWPNGASFPRALGRGVGGGRVVSGLVRSANGSAPDEAVEEQRGVADDARRPGLFVLTALQGQPVVHVTFSVEARLDGGGRGQDGGRTTGFNVRVNCVAHRTHTMFCLCRLQ